MEYILDIITATILYLLGQLIIKRKFYNDGALEKRIYNIGFLLRLVSLFLFILIMYHYGKEPFIFSINGGRADDYIYHTDAIYLSEQWKLGNLILIGENKFYFNKGFILLNTIIYYIFGPNTVILRLFNIFLSSLSAVFVLRTAKLIASEKAAKISAYMTAIFPTFIFISILQYRDVIILFLLVLLFYHLARFHKYGKGFSGSVLVLVLIYFFRKPLALIGLFVLLIASFDQKRAKYRFYILLLIFILTTFTLLNMSSVIQGYSSIERLANIDRMYEVMQGKDSLINAFAEESLLKGMIMSSILGVLTPIPGNVNNIWYIGSIGSTFNYLVTYPFFLFGLRRLLRINLLFSIEILVMLVSGIAMIGGSLNGGNLRYFLVYLPQVFIVTGLGLEFRQKVKGPYFMYLLAFFLITLIYLTLKYVR